MISISKYVEGVESIYVEQPEYELGHDGSDGKQYLPEPDIIPQDRIMKAEEKHISQEIPADQGKGGGVGPDDGHIYENKEPGA